MKALLVADDEKAITNISEVLKSAGYDTIVYKWLLKALDNIEEIAPHLIIISTGDYPRHWKTLAQYSSIGIGDYKPQIILYTDENFSEEEQKKAEILHVRGTFDSVEVEGLDKLREILKKADDIFSGYLTEAEQSEITVDDLVPNAKKFVEAEIEEIGESEQIDGIEEELIDEVEESEPLDEVSAESNEKNEDDSIDEDSFDKLASKVESTEPLGEVSEDESFENLSNMLEKTDSENKIPDASQTNEDSQEYKDDTIPDEDSADRLEEMANDEIAANRLEEITGDEKAADKLEEMAGDDKAADKLAELAESEKTVDNAEGISEEENQSENEGVPTVNEVLCEAYNDSEATELPGIDELKTLLEENNPEGPLLEENKVEELENNDIIEEKEDFSEAAEAELPDIAADSDSENEDGEKNMSDEQSIEEKLAAIMNANKADQKEKAEALKLDSGTSSVSFVFTNPITLAMVSGVARNYNGLVLEFTPDIPNFIMNLSPGTKIDIASMKIDDKIENVFAEVMSNDETKLALAIKKIS